MKLSMNRGQKLSLNLRLNINNLWCVEKIINVRSIITIMFSK